MCSSTCTAARAARDDRAAARDVFKKRLARGAIPLKGGFKKGYPVTEISNLQRIIYEEAKRIESKKHSEMLNVSSHSCRNLNLESEFLF